MGGLIMHHVLPVAVQMGATLYYLPTTVRKVKHYGGFVAWQLDKAAFWVLTIFYHITMLVIFLVNDYLH